MVAQPSPVTLPYFATVTPRALPTEAEIVSAADISLAYGGRRVVEIGPYFVVKFGESVDLIEGENMLFVREKTGVPVPRTLLSVWTQLDSLEKKYIVAKLRSYFDELRALQAPSYYGSIGERRLLDGVFWTEAAVPAINGPFASEEAFLEALPLKYTYDDRSIYRAEFYRQCLPRVLRGHKPMFTHGDCQRKNVLVRKTIEDDAEAGSPRWEVFVLDWEKSGWYPSYWEYCFAYCALRWDDDWCLWVQEALNPYVSEAAWIQAIRLELWS